MKYGGLEGFGLDIVERVGQVAHEFDAGEVVRRPTELHWFAAVGGELTLLVQVQYTGVSRSKGAFSPVGNFLSIPSKPVFRFLRGGFAVTG